MTWKAYSAVCPLPGKGEDAVLIRDTPDGSLLLGVADGAGSAPRSAYGSRTALRYALGQLECPESWTSDGMRRALEHARSVVAADAAFFNRPETDYLTTLVLGVLTEDRVLVGSIGDSLAVGVSASGLVGLLNVPTRGEFAGQTVFLNSRHFDQYVQTISVPASLLTGLCLHSDGFERLSLRCDAPHPGFYSPLMDAALVDDGSFSQNLYDWLSSDIAPKCFDDCSILVAVKA